MKGKEYSELYW